LLIINKIIRSSRYLVIKHLKIKAKAYYIGYYNTTYLQPHKFTSLQLPFAKYTIIDLGFWG
jgi:hypothetical protein